jgi:hypothetical protein
VALAREKEYAHLPRGRTPGPQTRRGYGIGRSGFVIKATAVLILAGGIAAYTYGSVCEVGAEGCEPPLIFGLAGALILTGLLLYWLGVYLDRRKRRRNATHLQLSLPRDTYRIGEAIEPSFLITNIRGLEGEVRVGLVCTCFYDYEYTTHTQHGRSTSRQTQTTTVHEDWVPTQLTPGRQSLRLTIPPAAPYSHEGKAVSYAWKVSARESRKGFDRFTDLPIWVEA